MVVYNTQLSRWEGSVIRRYLYTKCIGLGFPFHRHFHALNLVAWTRLDLDICWLHSSAQFDAFLKLSKYAVFWRPM